MQQAISSAVIKSIEIFSGLRADDCQEISQRATLASFKAGELIVSRSENQRELYCLVSGTVHVTSFGVNGREVSYKEKHAGDIFGELSAIDSEPRSADVYAKTDVTLFALSPVYFNELVGKHNSIAQYLLARFVAEIRSLTARVYSFSALSVSNRIRQMVLQLAESIAKDQNSAVIADFPTHAQVASQVTTTREAVTRELSKLASLGLIEKQETGGIAVKDIKGLSELIEKELS